MTKITQENRVIDIPGLNRLKIGDHVIVDASADNDRFEGVVIGIELQRLYGSEYLVPSITLLHDGYTTDGFKPGDCRKVEPEVSEGREIRPMPAEQIAKLKAAIEKRWDEKPHYQGGDDPLGSPGCMMRAQEILALIAAVEAKTPPAPQPNVTPVEIPGELEMFEGKLTKVVDASRTGWWRFHAHRDRDGYCDNPARGY